MKASDDDRAARLDAEWSTLMVKAQAGDRVAYERLLRGSVLLIRLVVVWQGVLPGRVDDVTRETLLIVHRARRSYDPTRSFSAWLCAIARHRAIDNLRSRERLGPREVFSPTAFDDHSVSGDDAENDHLDERRGQSGGGASNAFPAGQPAAIEALARRQLSRAEAATPIGRVKGAFTVTMHRIRKILRGGFGCNR